MLPMYDIVLVAVMIVKVPYGESRIEYQPVDYFNSWSRCYQEEKRLSQTKDKRTGYICVKVDNE